MEAMVSKMEGHNTKLDTQQAALTLARKDLDALTFNMVEVEALSGKNADAIKDLKQEVKRLEEAVKVDFKTKICLFTTLGRPRE